MSTSESLAAGSAGIDVEDIRSRLAEWIAARTPGASDVQVGPFTSPSGTGGTNVTLLGPIEWTEAGITRHEDIVARFAFETTSAANIATADNRAQRQIITALDQRSAVPVPTILWHSDDPADLGAPFWIMRRVPGLVPSDWPPYNTAGFLAEASVSQRRRLWESAVTTLTAIHRFEDLDALDRLGSPADALERQLEWWTSVTAATVLPDGPLPALTVLEDRLRWRLPVDSVPGLAWGDARLGNMIFEDFDVRAVLDWEMASLAGGELDLAWWLLLDWWDGEGRGHRRLDGLGTRDETIALWERSVGRSARHLDWHHAFAAYRLGSIVQAWAFRTATPKAAAYAGANPVISLIEDLL